MQVDNIVPDTRTQLYGMFRRQVQFWKNKSENKVQSDCFITQLPVIVVQTN